MQLGVVSINSIETGSLLVVYKISVLRLACQPSEPANQKLSVIFADYETSMAKFSLNNISK